MESATTAPSDGRPQGIQAEGMLFGLRALDRR